MSEGKKHIPLPWMHFDNYKDSTVMVVTAHPDDADWYCGGTVARLSKVGANVIYVIATDGGGGSKDTSLTRSKLAEIRIREQREANGILGVSDTVFLGHPDGGLRDVPGVDAEIADLIRKYKPDLFITFDPSRPENTMHPDHREASLAALRAVRFAVLPLCFTDEKPKEAFTCNEVLLFVPRTPEVFVNTMDCAFLKLRALAAHKSQMEHMLDGRARKLMDWAIEKGDTIVTRALLSVFAQMFFLETYRRFGPTEMLG
jgi:LmbE family N-acetylglucosaminyl deacetylase